MTNQNGDMHAVCWELTSPAEKVDGLRVVLAGVYVGRQLLSQENQRPRWAFTRYTTTTTAAEAAVMVTQDFEREWGGTLVIPPAEILMHPAEYAAIGEANRIPPAMRARVFTSLMRRDPRAKVEA